MAASTSFLLQPRGAQGQPGELVAGLPVLEHHGCPPPSMQPTPPCQSPSFEAAFDQVHSLGGETETSYLTDRALKHLLNASNLRLIAGNPPQAGSSEDICAQSTRQSELLTAQPSVVTVHDGAPSIHLPRPPPRGIPHLPLTNLPVPGQGDTARSHVCAPIVSRLTLFSS